MRSADELEIIRLEELAEHWGTKQPTYSAIDVFSPASLLFIWIWPQQIRENALMRYICWPFDSVNSSEVFELFTDASVNTENASFDDSCYGHGVEAVDKDFPYFGWVFALTYFSLSLHSS